MARVNSFPQRSQSEGCYVWINSSQGTPYWVTAVAGAGLHCGLKNDALEIDVLDAAEIVEHLQAAGFTCGYESI